VLQDARKARLGEASGGAKQLRFEEQLGGSEDLHLKKWVGCENQGAPCLGIETQQSESESEGLDDGVSTGRTRTESEHTYFKRKHCESDSRAREICCISCDYYLSR
jgi:hypothetical protein